MASIRRREKQEQQTKHQNRGTLLGTTAISSLICTYPQRTQIAPKHRSFQLNRCAVFVLFLAALAFTGAALIVGACVGLCEDFAFLLFLPAFLVVEEADGLAVRATLDLPMD